LRSCAVSCVVSAYWDDGGAQCLEDRDNNTIYIFLVNKITETKKTHHNRPTIALYQFVYEMQQHDPIVNTHDLIQQKTRATEKQKNVQDIPNYHHQQNTQDMNGITEQTTIELEIILPKTRTRTFDQLFHAHQIAPTAHEHTINKRIDHQHLRHQEHDQPNRPTEQLQRAIERDHLPRQHQHQRELHHNHNTHRITDDHQRLEAFDLQQTRQRADHSEQRDIETIKILRENITRQIHRENIKLIREQQQQTRPGMRRDTHAVEQQHRLALANALHMKALTTGLDKPTQRTVRPISAI
jgi:hypothetical protein